MADAINDALSGVKGFGTGLQSKGKVATARSATFVAPTGSTGLAEAMKGFVNSATGAYSQYETTMKNRAEERSNEIIRKMTPEQRRQAIADGTLLYKDDPYAMTALRQKTGRNAAYEVDTEIQGKITAGHFRTRQEMEEYRQQRLADRSKSYAEQAGIDPEDTDYKRGFDTDIVNRNAALFDQQNQFLSKNLEAQASIEARNDLTPLMSDPKFLGSADGAQVVSGYINNGLSSGEIPSDREALNALMMLVNDSVVRDGGATMLRNLKDKEINVLGGKTTVENLLGPEVYQDLLTKADTETYNRNAKRSENLDLSIGNALAQTDVAVGWQLINKAEQENDWIQTGEQMTPQRQKLIAAKVQLQQSLKQQAATGIAALEKRAQADNRQLGIEQAFAARMAGDNVSVDPKFLPVDENTGEYKESDMATFAAAKLSQIDRMEIPDAEKDAKKLAYLKADYKGGAFQAAFQTLTQDAAQEWKAAVIQGKPDNLNRLYELQRAYNTNPAILAQLYPESAGLMETLKWMGSNGIDPQVMIDAERNKPKTQEETRYRDEQWAAIKNDSSTAATLKYLPGQFETMARSVFDAMSNNTGDSSSASAAVTDFLSKSTVTFTEKTGTPGFRNTSFHGMISKADLQVDPENVDSWQAGQAIVEDAIQSLSKDSVWGMSGISVQAQDGNIILQNMTGSRMTISREQFQNIAKDRSRAAAYQAEQEQIKEVQRTQRQYDEYFRGGAQRSRVE
ncbi:internal virion protein [Pseudomonas phage PPpW-4]|uniref:Putative internal virion protein C n=1 Tax=Pseudomonas phage PPpW-4 TaxID=1279083 RepID=V5YTV5_9CAUD|nr:internal virion protein [Pseudomonas phage PPpW-4]BAO20709.1 putative internal virion protein C [Pseudomonas phage PPpW-4]